MKIQVKLFIMIEILFETGAVIVVYLATGNTVRQSNETECYA